MMNTLMIHSDSRKKIKIIKILIDELDLPGSSDFLPFPECDSVFYEDFSEVDALPSTNNEDKVFNPGILIHENLFEVTNCATPEKNVKKATNASLILEDFNPLLYELPFHKEVPGLGALLSFSSENEEKVFNPGILTSKRGSYFSSPGRLPDFKASRARSFVLRSQELHILSFILGIRYPKSYRLTKRISEKRTKNQAKTGQIRARTWKRRGKA
ncbi:hypothetical protein Tco_0711204 [Tanacetum coccineum]